MARTWSAQQLAVFEWFGSGSGNLVVRALAGTGKTTTILEAIGRAPEARILFAAFNKRIVEEVTLPNAQGVVKLTCPRAEAKTLHAVGFACIRRRLGNVRMAERGEREDRLVEMVCGPQDPQEIRRMVGKLMTKAREIAPLATQPGSLRDLAEDFDCIPDEEWKADGFDYEYVEARALEAMQKAAGLRSGEAMDFADMIFLPVRNGWMPKLYDMVVVDEGQDMTVAQLLLALGVCGGRFCIVGDNHQAIYGFRGADSESLDRLKAELKASELGLTVTYRCGKRIVEAAQQYVPHYTAAPEAPDGEISSMPFEKMVEAAEPGNFILSRANAPLAKVAMACIRANKRVRIQGKDIGAGLKALVKKLASGRAQNSIPELLAKLARWQERECERLYKADKPERCEAIIDKAETVRCLCEGVAGVRELEVRLDNLFADSGAVAIVCSSVHKAKGLEAKKVFILRDTLNPKPPKGVAITPKRAKEEANICYVAITRAIEHLVWVAGK